MNQYVIPIGLAVFLFAADANAEWVSAVDEYLFPPEMSESEACQKAERRATKKALTAVTGEKISSEDSLVCTEMEGDADCSLNRFTSSIIDGLIKGKRNKKMETVEGVSGYRKCRVSLEVNVGVGIGEPDPSFDMQVRINRPTFRDGENLQINLKPSQPMFINVFQFLPYMKAQKQVIRIFPNSYDKKNLFQNNEATIPTSEGSQKYDMTIGFPEELKRNKDKKLVDEYLWVLGTREPITFLDEYSHSDFSKVLLEIPRENRRLVKKPYYIVRPR